MTETERRARDLATRAHQGQSRDGGAPYISHPARVVEILKTVGGVTDDEVVCVGWLHDAVEDSDLGLEEIEREFGPEVARGVGLLTRERGGPDRDAALISGLRAHREDRFAVVKLADRLSNLEGMDAWEEKRKRTYAATALGMLWAVPEEANPAIWNRLLERATAVLMTGRG
jgi:(p)ppGpp synthase/HD superfamily hydrolase